MKKKYAVNELGLMRRFDPCGRITIPIEYRKFLNLDVNKDCLEMKINENKEIVLKKIKNTENNPLQELKKFEMLSSKLDKNKWIVTSSLTINEDIIGLNKWAIWRFDIDKGLFNKVLDNEKCKNTLKDLEKLVEELAE